MQDADEEEEPAVMAEKEPTLVAEEELTVTAEVVEALAEPVAEAANASAESLTAGEKETEASDDGKDEL